MHTTVLAALLTICRHATAIRCYDCIAPLNGSSDCFANKLGNHVIKECVPPIRFCQTNISIGAMFGPEEVTSLQRGCAESNDIRLSSVYREGGDVQVATSCEKDLCNNEGPVFIDELAPNSTQSTARSASSTTEERRDQLFSTATTVTGTECGKGGAIAVTLMSSSTYVYLIALLSLVFPL